MWRQFLQRPPSLPSVDVRRDLASVARWWSSLLLLDVGLAAVFVVSALWVWLSLSHDDAGKQDTFVDPTFEMELDKEVMERRLRTLERELQSTVKALRRPSDSFEGRTTEPR